MKSLKNLNFEKIQNVGIRVDFNVPIDKNFKITDKTRLDRAKDTINFIKNKQCNILLLSHFGRPKENFDDKYSFTKLIDQFQEILKLKLNFINYENFLENLFVKVGIGSRSKLFKFSDIIFFPLEEKSSRLPLQFIKKFSGSPIII